MTAPETRTVEAAARLLWELSPDDDVAEALMLVLPIVDAWVEDQKRRAQERRLRFKAHR